MNSNIVLDSKLLKGIIIGLSIFIIIAVVFSLGVFVGTERANFTFKWASEYHRNFGGPQGGFLGGMMGQEFTESNGVFGQIIKIDGQILSIKGADNVEKNILIGEKTSIVYQKKNIKISELKIDDNVIAIGDPNDKGQIQAELIRVMPALPKPPPITTN